MERAGKQNCSYKHKTWIYCTTSYTYVAYSTASHTLSIASLAQASECDYKASQADNKPYTTCTVIASVVSP